MLGWRPSARNAACQPQGSRTLRLAIASDASSLKVRAPSSPLRTLSLAARGAYARDALRGALQAYLHSDLHTKEWVGAAKPYSDGPPIVFDSPLGLALTRVGL